MSKIKSIEELEIISKKLREEGKIIILTNGCYDILHSAHVRLLAKAKEEGDVLIVLLNSDKSIKSFKSEDRPIVGEKDRAEIMAALESVDYVCLFEEDDPIEQVKIIKPHKVVKGGTFIPERVASHIEALKTWGGEFKNFELEEGYSSTNIIDKIKSLKD